MELPELPNRLLDLSRSRPEQLEHVPPEPYATFTAHAAANGFDFSRDERFGFLGDAFVACFGDAAPVTTCRITPAGFKVARVDMAERHVVDFAVNRITGGASVLPHDGSNSPSTAASAPTAPSTSSTSARWSPPPERGGVEIRLGTGVLWRIRRTGTTHRGLPPQPRVVPLNLLRLPIPAAGIAAGAATIGRLTGRRRRRRH